MAAPPVVQVRVSSLQTALLRLNDNTATHVSLRGRNIGRNGFMAIREAIERNTSLQQLELSTTNILDSHICDGDIENLPPRLRRDKRYHPVALRKVLNNTSLQLLDLSCNRIGDSGAAEIVAALGSNTSLQTLALSRNQIGKGGLVTIGAVLERNSSLRQLELSFNQIGDGGAVAIGAALKHNNSLQQLYLSDNQIGDVGAAEIVAALESNTSLHTLVLSRNQIREGGMVTIGAVLERNSSLRHLDLSENEIGDSRAIGTALECNRSLQQLNLSKTQIGDGGAAAIGAALKHNTSLEKLFLRGNNHIGDAAASALFTELEHNTTLSLLDLEYCPIRTLGTEFLETRRLDTCNLSYDELVWPPPSLASQGRKAIYRFLQEVKESSEPLTRSRVMFVGVGGSGKTTLKTALLLRGERARVSLLHLRESMIETIKHRWTEADLQEWVDTDLSREPGFYASCKGVKGLTGEKWLKQSADTISQIFGNPGTFTSKDVVAQMTAVLKFLTSNLDEVPTVPYEVLLNIPHVWTEGVELDTRWEKYTLWDFPGQMELYPSHRLFLACETAVYVLVVNGRTGKVDECMLQMRRWLSLIRSGMRDGGSKVETRIVVTHTDTLTTAHRNSLLRDLHDNLVAGYADHFDVGERCYATTYGMADGGDVDTVRAELTRLRSVLPPNRPLPTIYQAICSAVVKRAREDVRCQDSRWPVVPISAIDWRGQQDEALVCLEDLGFVRRANGQVILEPVTWLSTLMSAFLHPLHGIGSLCPPPHPKVTTAAEMREHHNASVLLDAATACQIVNLRTKLVGPEHESEVLPLMAHFDICFSPLDDGKYVFPSLLPLVTSLPSWLACPFEGAMEGRRYVCSGDHDFIPPTVAILLMERVVAMGRRFGGMPMFFGRGTVVMGCDGESLITVHLSDDDRSLDLFANATDILSFASLQLMEVLVSNYRGIRLCKQRIARLPHHQETNPFVPNVCDHPMLGMCRVDAVTTVVRDSCGVITPEWLRDAYESSLPEVPDWHQDEYDSRVKYLVSKWKDTVGDRAHLLVDDHLVEETHVPVNILPPSDGPLIVVVSCPHTMSLTNTAPFRPVDNVNVFDVFAHCEALQRAGRIQWMAFDRPGTSTTSDRDTDVIWSVTDPRLDGRPDKEKWAAVRESVSESVWFHGFQTSIKKAITLAAQSDPGRDIRLVCIQGGPITELEQEYMSKIVQDSQRDAAVFGLTDLKIDIAIRAYRDFRNEFPVHDGSGGATSASAAIATARDTDRKRTADRIATDASAADQATASAACPDTSLPVAQRPRVEPTADPSSAVAPPERGVINSTGGASASGLDLNAAAGAMQVDEIAAAAQLVPLPDELSSDDDLSTDAMES